LRSGSLPSSAFVRQVQSELKKYMDAVRVTGIDFLEDVRLSPGLVLTEHPTGPLEEIIASGLKISLGPAQ